MFFEKINPNNIENIELCLLIIDKKHIKDTNAINY